jgi:spore coat protein U-like protein
MNAKHLQLALMTAAFVAVAYFPNLVVAQQRVGNLDVSVSVAVRCKLESYGDIALGSLDPAHPVNTFAASEIRVACTRGAVYRLRIDDGRNFSGERQTRQMTTTQGDKLPYALTVEDNVGRGNGWFQPAVIRLAASVKGSDYIDLPAGQYQDVIRVSVEY